MTTSRTITIGSRVRSYPVRYQGAFSGTYQPIGLDGDFSVRLDLRKVRTESIVTLPKACARPISR
jgi:hypothetical protein